MIRYLITTFFLACNLLTFGQLQVNTRHHHFGVLHRGATTTTDFYFKNTGPQTLHILRADAPEAVQIRYSKTTLAPDSTAIMRVHCIPNAKGPFRHHFPLYISTSPTPIWFEVTGTVNYRPTGRFTPCPDFNSTDPYRGLRFHLELQTLDSTTGQRLGNSKIRILSRGVPYPTVYTDKNGEAYPEVRTGSYYFVVTRKGYDPKEFSRYFNRANRVLRIHLVPEKKDHPAEKRLTDVPGFVPPAVVAAPAHTDTVVESTVPEDPLLLPRKRYSPNNIVFLIDVSSSMKQKGRMDLLKAAIIELLAPLRDIDRIAVVTYASGSQVVLPSQPASNKEMIVAVIQSLNAGGRTEGGKGLRRAYAEARKNFITGGNNQVFIATDGAFSDTDTNHNMIVKKNMKRGIRLSVAGVVNESRTEKSMINMARSGNGRYLHIENYDQSKHLLLEEIKSNSVKK